MTAPTIAVSGVTHRYGDTLALDIAELFADGGATAVLGPNGSGKSTLMRLLATLMMSQTGSIRIDGLDPTVPVERIAIRRRLGYVAQTDGLPGRLKVAEFCDYIAALKEIGPERLRRRWTAWALDRVGLGDLAADRISTLSGGMRRRLSIAQSLLGGPDLLVLDEPLTSLDAGQRSEVTSLITQTAAESSVVVATHHADELASVCGRIVVLDHGRSVFIGSPSELARRAAGRVWESSTPTAGATCRAVGPDRFHCVGDAPPPGAPAAEPTVADGYLTVIGRH